MLNAFSAIRAAIASLFSEEGGQDTFEYMLIIGGVTVAVIAAIVLAAPGLLSQVITGVCNAIQGIMSTISC